MEWLVLALVLGALALDRAPLECPAGLSKHTFEIAPFAMADTECAEACLEGTAANYGGGSVGSCWNNSRTFTFARWGVLSVRFAADRPMAVFSGGCSSGLAIHSAVGDVALGLGPAECLERCTAAPVGGMAAGGCGAQGYGIFVRTIDATDVLPSGHVYTCEYGDGQQSYPWRVVGTSLGEWRDDCVEIWVANASTSVSAGEPGRCSEDGFVTPAKQLRNILVEGEVVNASIFRAPQPLPFTSNCSSFSLSVAFPEEFAHYVPIPIAAAAREYLTALWMALEHVNDDPTLPRLSLEMFDDSYYRLASAWANMEPFVSAFGEPCSVGAIGPIWAQGISVIAPLAVQYNKVVVSTIPSSVATIDKSWEFKNLFRMLPTLTYRSVPAMLRHLGVTRIALFYDHYHADFVRVVELELEARHIILDLVQYVPNLEARSGEDKLEETLQDPEGAVKAVGDAMASLERVGSRVIIALLFTSGLQITQRMAGERGLIGPGYAWICPRHGDGPIPDAIETIPDWTGRMTFGNGRYEPSATMLAGWEDTCDSCELYSPGGPPSDIAVIYYSSIYVFAEAIQAAIDNEQDPTDGETLAQLIRDGASRMKFDVNQDLNYPIDFFQQKSDGSVFIVGTYDGVADAVIPKEAEDWGYPVSLLRDGSGEDAKKCSVDGRVYNGKTGITNEFTLYVVNSFGEATAPVAAVEVLIEGAEVVISATETNGTLTVTYTIAKGGDTDVHILVAGENIPESPFRAKITSSGLPGWLIAIIVVATLILFFMGGALIFVTLSSKRAVLDPQFTVDPDEIEVLERLGVGSFGEVFRGKWRGSEVAVKKLHAHAIVKEAYDDFIHEIGLMCQLRHPNCLLFMGASTDIHALCIVTEFMELGDVHSLLHNPTVDIPYTRRLRWMSDCARGMNFLHSADPSILHRDLKSLNLLVTASWDVKVADFGMSGVANEGEVGSFFWAAPEILANANAFTAASDVYSFGVIVWEIATRIELYSGQNVYAVANDVMKGSRPVFPDDTPMAVKDLATSAWAADPSERPSFETLSKELKTMLSSTSCGTSFRASSASYGASSEGRRPPHGVVTIVASVFEAARLWAEVPEIMPDVYKLYNSTHRKCIAKRMGHEIPDATNACMMAVFHTEEDAILYAMDCQERMMDLPWPERLLAQRCARQVSSQNGIVHRGPRFSCGLHTGLVDTGGPECFEVTHTGEALLVARDLATSAQAGQILITSTTFARLEIKLTNLGDPAVVELEAMELRGVPVGIVQVTPRSLDRHFTTADLVSSMGLNVLSEDYDDLLPAGDEEKRAVRELDVVLDYKSLTFYEMIGQGSFAETYRGELNGSTVALKKLVQKHLKEDMYLNFRQEVTIMCMIQHPNVIKLIGFTNPPTMCIVEEHAQRGSLGKNLLDPLVRMPLGRQVNILTGIAKAMQYLHARTPKIIHRDLKADNCLLMEDWSARIADFGLARLKSSAQTMTKCGSIAWTAPEILRGEEADERIDVYSFGVLMFEVSTRTVPYDNVGQLTAMKHVQAGRRPQPPKGHTYPPKFQALMEQCWDQDAQMRPHFSAIVDKLEDITD